MNLPEKWLLNPDRYNHIEVPNMTRALLVKGIRDIAWRNQILETGLKEFGIKEIPGDSHNSRILEYFKACGHSWVKDDETAWCSAYINYVAIVKGFTHSGKLNARSWLNVGNHVILGKHKPGHIAVFWRNSLDSVWGHVGIYVAEDENFYYILGGNQGNKVQISPYRKERLLGFRELYKIIRI